MTDDELLSARQAADRANVALRTLYDLRWRRRGPAAVKVGRALWYRPADIDAWVEQRTTSYPEAWTR